MSDFMKALPTFTPQRWQQVKNILAEALELPPGARARFLNEACEADDALRAEVELLLALEADSFIEQPAFAHMPGAEDQVATLLEQDEMTAVGARQQRIGPYRILSGIAHGGMGAVYLAERADDQYRQQVALKLIRQGFASSEVLKRFRNERQILAALDHPNIARMLDGGTTQDAEPYLVMEYIAGEPIDQYCDARKLNTVERLKLFRTVCHAVHYAHQRLIIHRDLKPSNILVTQDGTPKLLDFGIAKLLAPELAAQTLNETAPEMRLMTPAYASPEQMKGEPITTATDVYSLGVLLYELLTGQRPYRLKTNEPQELLRAVCEEEPEPPSTAITRKTETTGTDAPLTPAQISETRDGQPDKLRRKLKGDIDNIVLMALRKEPARRYQSVEQFAEDIRRHLEGLPVIARKDTLRYRTSKFVRRNKLALSAAALVLLTLIGGIVTTQRARARAERRFNDVRQLARAVVFDYHDAIAQLPGATPVRERLVKDALVYLDSLAAEADNDAGLQRELAAAYEKIGAVQGNNYHDNLGDTEGAMRSYQKSLAIRQRLIARAPNDLALQGELADSHCGVGDMHYTMTELAEGLRHYEQAKQLRQKLLDAEPHKAEYRRALAEIYGRIGDIKGMEGYPNLGDTAGALESYRQNIKLREELYAAAPEDKDARFGLAKARMLFGYLSSVAGDARAALESGRRAVSLLEALATAEPNNTTYSSQVGASYTALRMALVDSGLLAEAIANDLKVVQRMEAMVAADPQNTQLSRSLSVSLTALGRDLKTAGQATEALTHLRRSLKIIQALSAADPQNVELRDDVAITWLRLGEAQHVARDFAAALAAYREAAAIKEAMMQSGSANALDQDDLATINAGIGNALAATGDTAGARATLQQAVQLAEAAAAQSPDNAKMKARFALRRLELARLHARLGATPAACAEFAQSLKLWEQLRDGGKLIPTDAAKPDEVARESARCKTVKSN